MSQADADLEARIASLLADPAHAGHPLHAALAELSQRHRELNGQLARLSWISDRYQSAVRDEHQALSERYERQQRRQQKIARISDSYQQLQREQTQKLRVSANLDALTGLPNRRLMLERLQLELRNSAQSGEGFCVAVLDIDRFKRINDECGHDVGDRVLTHLAAVLSAQLRSDDFCARWGGEEFLLLWPKLSAAAAAEVGERLRAAIEAARPPGAPQSLQLSASIGIALHQRGAEIADTVKCADLALYEAKRRGRNRVVLYSDATAPSPETIAALRLDRL